MTIPIDASLAHASTDRGWNPTHMEQDTSARLYWAQYRGPAESTASQVPESVENHFWNGVRNLDYRTTFNRLANGDLAVAVHRPDEGKPGIIDDTTLKLDKDGKPYEMIDRLRDGFTDYWIRDTKFDGSPWTDGNGRQRMYCPNCELSKTDRYDVQTLTDPNNQALVDRIKEIAADRINPQITGRDLQGTIIFQNEAGDYFYSLPWDTAGQISHGRKPSGK